MSMRLSFVILTWNSASTIGKCLASIAERCDGEQIPYEVLIVDNGSCDETCEIIERFRDMPVSLTRHRKNQGTTRTRNSALRQCTGDVICVMDSDASFIEGSLRRLVETLMADESIGILAPRLIESDGNVQASVKRFPSALSKIARIPKILFKLNISDAGVYPAFPFHHICEVDSAISANWFFRRSLLDEVGYLDEHIFYAPEDVDFCLRIKKHGRRIVYYPPVTVLHETQQITHKNTFSIVALSHFYGLVYYFWKHRYISSPRVPECRPDSSGKR